MSERPIKIRIRGLRKRFGDLGVVIRTVRGFGYLMELAQASGAPGGDEPS